MSRPGKMKEGRGDGVEGEESGSQGGGIHVRYDSDGEVVEVRSYVSDGGGKAAMVVSGPPVPQLNASDAQKTSGRAAFLKKHVRYREDTEDYAKTAGGKVHIATLKACVEPSVLTRAVLARTMRDESGEAVVDEALVTKEILA